MFPGEQTYTVKVTKIKLSLVIFSTIVCLAAAQIFALAQVLTSSLLISIFQTAIPPSAEQDTSCRVSWR